MGAFASAVLPSASPSPLPLLSIDGVIAPSEQAVILLRSSLPLSPDLQREVFLHLPRHELLHVLPLVCKSFRAISTDDRLWQDVCTVVLGRRSLPLVLMYAASELSSAHDEQFALPRLADNSVPWRAVYSLLHRLSGPQYEHVPDMNVRTDFIRLAEMPLQLSCISQSDATAIIRDLLIIALSSEPQVRMAMPHIETNDALFSFHRGRKDLPRLTMKFPNGFWLEICFYDLPIEPPSASSEADDTDAQSDSNNDTDATAEGISDNENNETALSALNKAEEIEGRDTIGRGLLPVVVEQAPRVPHLVAVCYVLNRDGYSLVNTDWSESFYFTKVSYYHPSVATRLWKEGVSAAFMRAAAKLNSTVLGHFHGINTRLNELLIPVAPLHQLRSELVRKLEIEIEASARAALVALFGNCFEQEGDTRKLREAKLGMWLSRLLDSVRGPDLEIGTFNLMTIPTKKRIPKPKKTRVSHLPLVALIRCIRRLCRFLLESSLLQWVHLIHDYSIDDFGVQHNLTYELLDLYYTKQSFFVALPPTLSHRPYVPARSRPAELLLVEWPLHTLRRMRSLIEPVTVLVTNFIHASAPLNITSAVSLIAVPETELSLRTESATECLLTNGLVNSTVYSVLEALLPREVQPSSSEED